MPDASRVAAASDYRDPVPGFEGRWLAGLAPVGDTGLIVVIQTRYDSRAPLERFGLLFGLPIAFGGLVAALIRRNGRRRAP